MEDRYSKLEESENELAQVRETMIKLRGEIKKHLKNKEDAKDKNNEDEICVYHYYASRDKVELNEKIELYEGKVNKIFFGKFCFEIYLRWCTMVVVNNSGIF